jgi:hypothetical protein
MYVKIKDKPNLVRDVHSKALLSTDRQAVTNFEKAQAAIKKREQEFEDLKIKMGNIEILLLQLLSKIDKNDLCNNS